jgi:phosphoglycolate phosphatase
MSLFEHVIFDFDGTLVDSAPGITRSINAALESCGMAPAQSDLARLIGPPLRTILATVSAVTEPDALDRLERSFRSHYDSGGWRRTVCQPGVPKMLRHLLNSGTTLWMVTNKPSLATGKILGELQLAGLFREVACRDSRTPPFRCKAEMLIDLLQRNRLDRAQSLMVGDTAEDWQAAETAGITCVVVPHGYGSGPVPSNCDRIGGWEELQEICRTGRTVSPFAESRGRA